MRGRGRAHTKVLGTLLYGICSSILLPRSRPPIGVLVRKEIQQDEIYSGCSKRPEVMPSARDADPSSAKVDCTRSSPKENEANGSTKVG